MLKLGGKETKQNKVGLTSILEWILLFVRLHFAAAEKRLFFFEALLLLELQDSLGKMRKFLCNVYFLHVETSFLALWPHVKYPAQPDFYVFRHKQIFTCVWVEAVVSVIITQSI